MFVFQHAQEEQLHQIFLICVSVHVTQGLICKVQYVKHLVQLELTQTQIQIFVQLPVQLEGMQIHQRILA